MRLPVHTWRWVLALLFVGAGINHFLQPAVYLRIMPPALPGPALLVALSGAAEVALGLLLLLARTRRWAAWGLVLLLLAVFPANIYMARHADLFAHLPAWLLWLRLPLQGVLVAWAYRYTRRP